MAQINWNIQVKIIYNSTVPQSQDAIIFLCITAYDSNLSSHQLKLSWYFCIAALSERSGKRMAEALSHREAHCGQSVPKVGCHSCNLMANVKGHCGSWNDSWRYGINLSGTKLTFFFVCIVSCVLFGYVHVWMCICMSVCVSRAKHGPTVFWKI